MTGLLRETTARLYNSAVIWALVFTAVRTGGNLLVLPLLLHKLTPDEMGLWYVFLSLSAMSAMIDLGFSPTMTRATAFFWAGADDIQPLGVTAVQAPDDVQLEPNYIRIAELVQTMRLYYRAAGVLVTLLLGSIGSLWIIHKTQHLPNANWVLLSWLLFLPAVFINTTSGMWHPLLSGINQVRLNQQIMAWGLLANYTAMLTGLLLGAGLLAPVAGYLLMGLVSRNAARAKFLQLTHAKRYQPSARASTSLLRKLWPTAWRTGLVTLGLYVTINLNTLICSVILGLKATASYGLSLQLALAAVGIATTFLAVKIPLLAQLHARGKTNEISRIVFARLRWFWVLYIALGLFAIFFGQRVLQDIFHSRTPLLPTPLLIALFIVIGLEGHHAIFREIALTSHRNPFAKPVIISATLIVFLSLLLAPWIGLWGLILAPGIVQLCFNNWWTVLVGLRSMGSSVGDYLLALFREPSRSLWLLRNL